MAIVQRPQSSDPRAGAARRETYTLSSSRSVGTNTYPLPGPFPFIHTVFNDTSFVKAALNSGKHHVGAAQHIFKPGPLRTKFGVVALKFSARGHDWGVLSILMRGVMQRGG